MGYLIGIGILAVLAYAGSCWWYPFTACGRCDGAGKHQRKDGKVWRTCRRCGGTGRRLRAGRWVWNRLSARREAARKAAR